MKRLLILATALLPIASFAQSYTTNGVVYATSGSSANASTAASTSPGQFLIGMGSAPTWASSLPFAVVVNQNTSASPPGLAGGWSGLLGAELTGADGESNYLFMDAFGAQNVFGFRRALNTNGSPEAIAASTTIGMIAWNGYNGTSYEESSLIIAQSVAQWSATNTDSRLSFFTTAVGSTSEVKQMSLFGSGGLALGSSIANTDPGAGNLLVAGRVGIGTTDQTYPLSVNGTIEAKEVIVQSGWSDYVLAPTYHLEPLEEVAASIKAEGHLPGVPSEKEIVEHGAKVGEMQTILLAKIEELTLHAIEQERRLDNQARRIDELAQKNQELSQGL